MSGARIGITLLLLLAPATVRGETVRIEAGRDATLIEDPGGALANGSGPVFFVGRTNQPMNSVRRGLVRFDVAGALPANALVESVRLTLFLEPSHGEVLEVRLHRLLDDWGEGTSYATGGSGDDAAPGDATWIHTFHDDSFWVREGGQFLPRASAAAEVGDTGFYSWEDAAWMRTDVRLWLAAPHRNFGWLFLADETSPQTVKSFASREEPDASLRPVLEVTYRLPGD